MLMLIAALTGNFGMGKSYVLSIFRGLGAVTLDSDRIVGMLLKEKGVIAEVTKLLGSDVTTSGGSLDKKAIAGKIFHDRSMKDGLEALLHPLVFKKINDFTGRIKKGDSLVIVEVPLLFEGNYHARFEKVITVCTPEEVAIERLIRKGVPESEAKARLKNQLPVSEKKVRSDYVIDNSGSKEETKRQVDEVFRALRMEMSKRIN